jgi:hypothetical protein
LRKNKENIFQGYKLALSIWGILIGLLSLTLQTSSDCLIFLIEGLDCIYLALKIFQIFFAGTIYSYGNGIT